MFLDNYILANDELIRETYKKTASFASFFAGLEILIIIFL